MKKIVIIFIFFYILVLSKTYATDEIIKSQMDELNLSTLIKEGQEYTKDAFPDIDINELLNSSLAGKINNKIILNDILSIFGNELRTTITLIGNIIVIIIIHSILKSFSENLGRMGVVQIAYYIEYILIVTVIISNFTNIITIIKETITNMVGFITTLIPILLALMVASRKCSISFINTTNIIIFYSFYS